MVCRWMHGVVVKESDASLLPYKKCHTDVTRDITAILGNKCEYAKGKGKEKKERKSRRVIVVSLVHSPDHTLTPYSLLMYHLLSIL